jgi:nitrogen permease regulator 3-like protein
MAIFAPPPNPSLVAIILVVQARSGPCFVYHYPPAPLSKSVPRPPEDGTMSYENSSISDDETISTSDEDGSLDGYGRGRTKPKRANVANEEEEDSPSPVAGNKNNEEWRAPWDHLLGLDASALEKLLMPSDRSWHKRRFEVAFNELVFVGWPVFVREDGTWRKKRRKEKISSTEADVATANRGLGVLQEGKDDAKDEAGHLGQNGLSTLVTTDTDSAQREEKREMTTFNVVFVLNPPVLEYSLRVKEMYEHVVKKLGKALKWEQARANYVWTQSDVILKTKAQASDKSPLPLFLF